MTSPPVIFLIFRRPDTTERVFEKIRQAEPEKLLIVADGPRVGHSEEAKASEQTRSIVEDIHWDCDVYRNYAAENLGCAKRVSSGLDWAFEKVDQAIILEDDCLPDPSFFKFCEKLLEKYEDDKRIMSIGGDHFPEKDVDYSYYFSHFFHCWGWATWASAWEKYDHDLTHWPEIRKKRWLSDLFQEEADAIYWRNIFDGCYKNEIDTWDYRFQFASWINSGLHILPDRTLVSNIGFGESGHNTTDPTHPRANLKTESCNIPLDHPPFQLRDIEKDYLTQRYVHNRNRWVKRVVKGILRGFFPL